MYTGRAMLLRYVNNIINAIPTIVNQKRSTDLPVESKQTEIRYYICYEI